MLRKLGMMSFSESCLKYFLDCYILDLDVLIKLILTITSCSSADKYLSQRRPDSYVPGDGTRFIANQKENGFVSDPNNFGYQSLPKEEGAPFSTTAAASPRILDPRIEPSKKPIGSIAALKELVSIIP